MPNDVRLRVLFDSSLDDFVSFWFLVEAAEEQTLHAQRLCDTEASIVKSGGFERKGRGREKAHLHDPV